MKNQISIDKLNEHLFESIEMLKNNTDKNASENEKMDVDTAKVIADLAGKAIEGFKVKAQALQIIAKTENPSATMQVLSGSGIVSGDTKALTE